MSNIYGDSIFESSIEDVLKESFDDMYYSPKQIQEMCDFFANIPLSEAVLSSINEAAMDATKGLKKLGCTNINEVNSGIKTASTKIAQEIKTNGVNKESRKKIYSIIEESISKANLLLDNKDDPKIVAATKTLLSVILANNICHTVLLILFGPAIGNIIFVVFVAPVTEEFAKKMAIKGDYIVQFTAMFNAVEFSQYVLMFGPTEGFAKMVKVRLMSIGMHLSTTIIEVITSNPKLQKLLHLDSQEDKDKVSFIGHVTGMLLHAAWNAGLGKVIVTSTIG